MKNWIFLFLGCSLLNVSLAQERCGTDQRHEQRYEKDLKYREQFVRAQEEIAAPQARIASGTIYKVPVVVHVLHLGTAVGVGANISDEQVYSAIYSLNEAYRKKGSLAIGNGEDAGIEFCLAQKDPNGNKHSGINRIDASSMEYYSSMGIVDENELQIKVATGWPRANYYNIWVVTEIDNNGGGGGVQGFAYYPPGYNYDGTIILYNAFGADPDGKKGYNLKTYTNRNTTLIHELGHAFNLRHTFHGDGTAGNITCPLNDNCAVDGDLVCDTPPHMRSNSNCEVGTNSCDNGNSTELYIHNFMDYSSEACQNEFTAGQIARMRNTFLYSRLVLVSQDNLENCGCSGNEAPISRFEKTVEEETCSEVTVQFTQRSINFPVAWEWHFPGGNPSSSNLENPVVTYSHRGSFPVILTTTSADGYTHTLSKKKEVTLAHSLATPWKEEFESINFPPAQWSIVNPDAGRTWISRIASGNGNSFRAACVENYNYNSRGATDDLISPEINLQGLKTPVELSFKVSHRQYQTTKDVLEVGVSADCGLSWQTVYQKSGAELQTTTTRDYNLAPNESSHWRNDKISLDDYVGSRVMLRFRNITDYGAHLFIDDVLITNSGYEVPEVDFMASATSVDTGDEITLISTSTGTIGQYLWEFEEAVEVSSMNESVIQVTFLTPGLKTVKLTATNPDGASGVEEKIGYIEVLGTTALSDTKPALRPQLYPNPAEGQVHLRYLQKGAEISLVNIFGQVVLSQTIEESETILDIQHLARGVYTVLVQDEKSLYSERLVVGQ
jgi:PKD repeat protein